MASPDFDDELSFNELTFGGEDDTDEDPQTPHTRGDVSPTDQETQDEGYLSSAQSIRHRGVSLPRPARGRVPAPLYAVSLTEGRTDLRHVLSPQAASSPRIRSRPRARSRSEGPRRAESTGVESSRFVVVRNLKPAGGLLQEFKQQARSAFGSTAICEISEEAGDEFAFVECTDADAAGKVVAYFNGREMTSGIILQAERCLKVTPGQDPTEYEKYGEKTDILVLKNLPFSSSEHELKRAIVDATGCRPPLEFTPRRTSAGTFSGMAFVRYDSPNAALAACRALDGVTIGDREIRVEFKRTAESSQRKRGNSGSPDRPQNPSQGQGRDRSPNEDRALRDIEVKLRQFVVRGGDQPLDFPASLSSSLRKHVHTTAAALGLQHTSEKREAGQRFVRVRKTSPLLSKNTHGLSASVDERLLETSTPASIRNDIRSHRHTDHNSRDRRRVPGSSANRRHVGFGPTSLVSTGGNVRNVPRPRANTLATFSSHAIDVVRAPRGPDGTKGFQSRSPAKAEC